VKAETNVKEGNTRDVYLPRSHGHVEYQFTLDGRNTNFVNAMKYLGVIFGRKTTCAMNTEAMETKVPKTFLVIYNVFKLNV
jgi:hypothetical protein